MEVVREIHSPSSKLVSKDLLRFRTFKPCFVGTLPLYHSHVTTISLRYHKIVIMSLHLSFSFFIINIISYLKHYRYHKFSDVTIN